MATVIVSQTTGFDVRNFWIENTAGSTDEHFETHTGSETTVIPPSRTDHYDEFAFDSGGLKFNYVGNWDLRAENNLLAAEGTVTAGGNYTQIVLEAAGVQAVSVTGLDFDVDFGTHTGLPIINLNEELNDQVSDILFGPGSDPDQAFANLHQGATTTIAAIAFAGADHMRGNDGNDRLIGYDGNDRLYGGGGDDRVSGGAGADRVAGGIGNDLVFGSTGADTVVGGAGDDRLKGGEDADLLIGGIGKDRLTGHGGNDTFEFNFVNHSLDATRDIIVDFTQGEDKIDLSDIDADTNLANDQDFTFVGTAAFSGQAGELRYVQRGTHTLIRGDVNGDGQRDFTIVASHVIAFADTDFI